MDDDPIEFDVIVIRKVRREDPEPAETFICPICERAKEQSKPKWRHQQYERPPLCRQCVSNWGSKASGPVFNRANYQTLKDLSAIISALQWEVKNGRYNKHL